MINLVKGIHRFNDLPIDVLWDKADDQVLAFRRGDLIFVFNFHPNKSYSDYGILTEPGTYKMVLNSDNAQYGGFSLIDEGFSTTP